MQYANNVLRIFFIDLASFPLISPFSAASFSGSIHEGHFQCVATAADGKVASNVAAVRAGEDQDSTPQKYYVP